MAVCANCGTQISDQVSFCPTCGARTGGFPPQPAPAPQQPGQAQTPAPPSAAVSGADDAQANKGMAILAYILFFVPLVAGAHKNSPFVRYHTNQGTVLFLGVAVWGVLYAIITAIATAILFNPVSWTSGGWGFFGIVTTILGLLWLVPAALCLFGIINAASGKTKPLPVIGKIVLIK